MRQRALAFRDVDVDADDEDGAALGIVEVEIARFHPAQRPVVRPHNAEFGLRLALALRQRHCR